MRKIRFDTQQPLKNPWAIDDLIGIKLFTKRQTSGPWLQGKYRLFFDKQFAVGKMANLPDAHTSGDTQYHQQ
ncbi:Uncharacterised protein [Shigella sonnei]|nr:Uncharacterised protein [Shigella sonnei]